jgi:hypothetical protein
MPRVNAPAPAVAGDVIRLTYNVVADNEQCQFSIDFMSNQFSASVAADAVLAAALIDASVAPHLKAALDPTATYEFVLVQVMSRADIVSQTYNTGTGVGTAGASHLPREVSARLQKNSVLKGQHGRGGMSVGPVPTTFTTPATDPNVLNAAGLVAYGHLVTDWGAAYTIVGGSGATFSPCISTRPLLGLSVVTHAQVISHLSMDAKLGTVKRRKPGRGI